MYDNSKVRKPDANPTPPTPKPSTHSAPCFCLPHVLAHLLNLFAKRILFIYLTFYFEIFIEISQKQYKVSLYILHPHAPNVGFLLLGVNISYIF